MGWLSKVKLPSESDFELNAWQTELTDFLFENKAIKFGKSQLKSKRWSRTFFNVRDINDGGSLIELARAYANAVQEYFKDTEITTLVGPSYAGIHLAVATAMMLKSEHGRNVHFTFDRKEEKTYGEATGTSKTDAAKRMFVGYIPKDGDSVLLLDDVITTGATKEDEINKLKSVADVKLCGLMLSCIREEVDEEGNDPVKEFSTKYKIPVHFLLKLNSQVVPYLAKKGKINEDEQRRILAYERAYGTEETKTWCRNLNFIERPKGIIPACDVPINIFEELVKATADIEGVVAYKIGFESLLGGLDKWVKTARQYTDKPIIYDHQKAMTDIPDTGRRFAEIIKTAGADAIIGFPESGPATQWEWIHATFEQDLEVLIGGEMTHPKYKLSEGGYISDEALVRMYVLGAKAGVNNFVVPGNKAERCEFYKTEITKAVPGIKPVFYSPGLVAQGGKISDVTKLFDSWYGIVGRGIFGDVEKIGRYFTNEEIKQAALEHVNKL